MLGGAAVVRVFLVVVSIGSELRCRDGEVWTGVGQSMRVDEDLGNLGRGMIWRDRTRLAS
jgi:hypothetical protein